MEFSVTELYMLEGRELVRKSKLRFEFVHAGSESETRTETITIGSHEFGRLFSILEKEFLIPASTEEQVADKNTEE